MLLTVEGLRKSFGGLQAVKNYELKLPKGEIYGLIGPNGAGKTTVLNMITGIIQPDDGKIVFDGVDITGKRPDQIAELGVARTFQNLRLFKQMTVKENLKVAAQIKHQYSLLDVIFSTSRYWKSEEEIEEEVEELIDLLGLERFRDELAGNLPFGIQKRVEIARALAMKPRIILLDEPASGMSSGEARELTDLLLRIHEERGISMLLVEHRVPMVMKMCSIVQVMNQGELIAEGPPEEIKSDARVIKAYLGRVVG